MFARPMLLLLPSLLFALAVSPCQAELVGWWKLDETSGTVAEDSSVNQNHGQVAGDAVWTTGILDGALSFDGVDDVVSLPIGGVIETLDSCTFAIWANYADTGAWNRIMDFGTGTANYLYVCPEDNNGNIRVAITANDGIWYEIFSGMTMPVDEWTHVALTVDAATNTMTLYVNGQFVEDAETQSLISDLGNTTNNWLGQSQYADPLFLGMLDDFRIYNEALTGAAIAGIMKGDRTLASNPQPAKQATYVLRDTVLAWEPGEFAARHDVYLGTSADDVLAATRDNPLGTLIAQDLEVNTVDPGRLEFGTTYYWRVDEVNAAPDQTLFPGSLWSFTVEPLAYPLAADVITAEASSATEDRPIENTINGSGLIDGQHSVASSDMWLSATGDGTPTVTYRFDQAYKLHDIHVWNSNTETEWILGLGVKDVNVEILDAGDQWVFFKQVQIPKATNKATYTGTSVDMNDVIAAGVRFQVNSTWGSIVQQAGLSEVVFNVIPTTPRDPSPEDGAMGVDPGQPLRWRAGREAALHEIYVGPDANSLALAGTSSEPTFLADLNLGSDYAWQIVEVNEAETPSRWAGPVWSLSTAEMIVIDDFESYNDQCRRIYTFWRDGLSFGAIPDCGIEAYAGNGTGAVVGNAQAPFAEESLIASGQQAMPLSYDNTGGGISEAVFVPQVQDWTLGGATTLTLWFHGDLANTGGQLYLKVNSAKVTYPDTAALTRPVWKQWNIDLASLGTTLSAVGSLTIGVEGAGKGIVRIDDIRLYREAPAAPAPTDPGTTDLAAQYHFDGTLVDSSGHGYDATSPASTLFFTNGPTPSLGQAASFNGINDYAELPIGELISTTGSMTVALWANMAENDGSWQRLFDFGSGETAYMFLTPRIGTNQQIRFAITNSGGGGESQLTAPTGIPQGWHHLAVTIDASTMTIALYVDGLLVDEGPTTLLPSDLGVTTQNWLGRSQYAADSYYTGAIDELVLYTRALSPAEIAYLAGDR